jgi:hypothetical protein
MDRIELPHEPRHLGVPPVVSKTIYEPLEYLAQTVHRSSVKITTISKQIEPSLHLSLVTKEYHRVRPKWFLSHWYVWHKPCTYLALTLTLSPNKPKWDSTWPTSPSSSIRCIQNDIRAFSMLGANRAPIFSQDYHYLQTDWSELPLERPHLGVTSGVSKTISEPMRCLAQTMHLPCNDTYTVSKRTEIRFYVTHIT